MILDPFSLHGVLSGVALLKEQIGYKRVLGEEGKPDPAVRKGSKKHVTDFENCKMPIACFQLVLSMNLSYCHRVL